MPRLIALILIFIGCLLAFGWLLRGLDGRSIIFWCVAGLFYLVSVTVFTLKRQFLRSVDTPEARPGRLDELEWVDKAQFQTLAEQ